MMPNSTHFVKGSIATIIDVAPVGEGGSRPTILSTHQKENGYEPLEGGYRYGGYLN